MAIVGFEFTKINVERKDVAKGKINISNNVALVAIKKSDLNLGTTKQSAIKFLFEYRSIYEPDFAKIELGGTITFLTDEKNSKEILTGWEKEKKIKKEVAEKIINAILSKSNIQSILLSNTVNLPPPVPMPKVTIAQGPKGKPDEKKDAKKEEQKSLKS